MDLNVIASTKHEPSIPMGACDPLRMCLLTDTSLDDASVIEQFIVGRNEIADEAPPRQTRHVRWKGDSRDLLLVYYQRVRV